MSDQSGSIAGDEHLIFTDAEDDGGAVACDHDPVGIGFGKSDDPVAALNQCQGALHRRF